MKCVCQMSTDCQKGIIRLSHGICFEKLSVNRPVSVNIINNACISDISFVLARADFRNCLITLGHLIFLSGLGGWEVSFYLCSVAMRTWA